VEFSLASIALVFQVIHEQLRHTLLSMWSYISMIEVQGLLKQSLSLQKALALPLWKLLSPGSEIIRSYHLQLLALEQGLNFVES
jgi:hypothetical protein